MDLAPLDRQIHPAQDLLALDPGTEILDHEKWRVLSHPVVSLLRPALAGDRQSNLLYHTVSKHARRTSRAYRPTLIGSQ